MATKKAATKKSPAKKALTRKAASKKSTTKTAATNSKPSAKPKKPSVSIGKEGKDPKGGLTQAGRDAYNSKTGSNLKPGVKGPADTPEKKRRKGSFLTRHYTTPRGPVVKDGKPTRQALQAAAWGEPVPETEGDEKKLAAKGRKLLDEYKGTKESS
jgi:hypothetical protein